MATMAFRSTNFRPDTREKIDRMVSIVEEYAQQGLRLTARQLYYQFVSRDLCPNTPAEYKKLTTVLVDARYAGLVDWDSIEDRGRVPDRPSEWRDLNSLVESALRSYRLPRWEGQERYVELWVEKQALAGVLEPLALEFHITLMVNKGYSSASAMYEAAQRMLERPGMDPVVLYLGDHDPSGCDMVRDIKDRLEEFGVENLLVEKVALTMDQVDRYDPPPNPAKITDSRARAYIKRYGDKSWEVDALPPDVLAKLIREAVGKLVDMPKMKEIEAREESDKKRLRQMLKKL
jgi:hypothetical protein